MKKHKPKIILASASDRRKQLLHPYCKLIVRPSNVDEKPKRGEKPLRFVRRAAFDKWNDIAQKNKDPKLAVLAADTIVALNDRILGKPKSRQQARRMLQQLSGKRHSVISSVVVGQSKKSYRATVRTSIQFRDLSNKEINDYLNTGEWKGKAGAYGIQGKASRFVNRMQGSLTSVIGLPLAESLRLINKF